MCGSSKSTPITDHARAAVCRLLNEHISGTIDLQLQVQKAVAAVKDHAPLTELNSIFDGVMRDLMASINPVGSRVRALGGQEYATIRLSAQKSHMCSPEIVDERGHLKSMLSSYAKYDSAARKIAKSVQELGDWETEALFA